MKKYLHITIVAVLLLAGTWVNAQELTVSSICQKEEASCGGIGPNNGFFALEVLLEGGSGNPAELLIYKVEGDDTTLTITETFTDVYVSEIFELDNSIFGFSVIDDGQEYTTSIIELGCNMDSPTGQAGMDGFSSDVIEVCYGDDIVVTADCVYVPDNDYSTASYVLAPLGTSPLEQAIAWSDDGVFPFSVIEDAGAIGQPLSVQGVIGFNEGPVPPNSQPQGIIDFEGLTTVVAMAQGETILNNGLTEVYSCGEDVLLYAPPGADVVEWSTGESTESILVNGDAGWSEFSIIVMGDDGCTLVDTIDVYFDETCVWAGDANYDGVADNYDVLALGKSFGSTGPERENASNEWEAQPAEDWTGSLEDGTNHKHSDCNGDGVVNRNDLTAINNNFDSTHGKGSSGTSAGDNDPPLMLALPDAAVQEGSVLEFPIILGTDALPATDIYGLAFTIEFDNELIQEGTVEILFDDSWLGIPDELLDISREDFPSGVVKAGVTRTNQLNATGFGQIGIFRGILIENVETKQELEIDFSIRISEVNLISLEEEFLPVFLMDQTFVVTNAETTSGLVENSQNIPMSVYPNPSNDFINIEFNGGIEVEDVEMLALDGSVVLRNRKSDTQLDVSSLSPGMYFLNVYSSQGIVTRKIQITR